MKSILTKAGMVCACLLLTACASIMDRGPVAASIKTNQEGANVSVTNGKGMLVAKGEAPMAVLLPRADGYFSGHVYNVEVSKPGYETRKITLDPEINNWYWGNLLIGGLIGGLIVDPVTGAMWTYDQDKLDVRLRKTEVEWKPLAVEAGAGDRCETGPSWTPTNRFLSNEDEILDSKTGLIWKRCLEGMKWDGQTCSGISEEFLISQLPTYMKSLRDDWRLPNIDELNSIKAGKGEEDPIAPPAEVSGPGCVHPALNKVVFSGEQGKLVFSNSVKNGAYSYGIDFSKGNLVEMDRNLRYGTFRGRVRLVRSVAKPDLVSTHLHQGTVN